MEDLLFFWIPSACVGALIGYFIGNGKGRGGDGAVWGLLLGPIGWLVVALGPDVRRKCPLCAGPLPDAKVTRCRHCGQEIVRNSAAAARGRMLPPVNPPAFDPIEEWEAKEKAKQVLQVPPHLRGRQVDDE